MRIDILFTVKINKLVGWITNPRNDATAADYYYYYGGDDECAAGGYVADDEDADLCPLAVVSIDYAQLTVCDKKIILLT